MLYATSYVSNTSGVFKGFHNGWGGQTGTALYRILSRFELRPAVFFDNGEVNRTYQEDATDLARWLRRGRPDLVYLDPPYNQHPYGSNYHVLNSVALWDKPALSPTITKGDKAAIRTDWRTERRSKYNHRSEATQEFGELLDTLNARWILTSYSTDGMIPLEDLVRIACGRGRTEVVLKGYKRYRVSTQRFSKKPMNVEFVLVTDTSEKSGAHVAAELARRIRDTEAQVLESHRSCTEATR
jgi:adenine-specific DNA-methyltransferase